MARLVKEKNIIKIYLDSNSNGSAYSFNLNTAEMLGLSGNQLKNTPKKSELYNFLHNEYRNGRATNVSYVLLEVFSNLHTTEYAHYLPYLSVADRMDSLNIPCLALHIGYYEELGADLKSLVAYSETEGFAWNDFSISGYRAWKKYREMLKKYGKSAETLTGEMLQTILNYHNEQDLTAELLDFYAYYLVRGKYWEYHSHNLRTIWDYRRWCAFIGKTPQKVNNFMREYVETKVEYERNKAEYDRRAFTAVYDKVRDILEFEHGNLQVVIPTEPNDLIVEGQRQHNCVGGYVDSVTRGDTYVVFVRHKNALATNYITCEIRKDGRIAQFYTAYNNYVREDEDKEFCKLYQEHIKTILEEKSKEAEE